LEAVLPFRFVHTADIHLDSPLKSLALRDPALAELVGNATRRAFVKIVNICLEERVDALLLAGDLYDGDQTSMQTARFLADQLRLLHEADIPVFIIRGNHDAISRITEELTLPDTVTIFKAKSKPFEIIRGQGDRPVWIQGRSFGQQHELGDPLSHYKAPVTGATNIGLLHTSLDGSTRHDPYAPCKLVDLQASGFHYWALGHIHKTAIHEGETTVVMPGIPQGRDIGEAGVKYAMLVTITDDDTVLVERRRTSIAQFEELTIDLTGISEWGDMARVLGRDLGRARHSVESEHLIARLKLTGTTPLAWRLRQDHDKLTTEAQAQADGLNKSWIDKVDVRCEAPVGDVTRSEQAGIIPLEELRRLMVTIAQDDGFLADITRLAEDLRGQLPADCREMIGLDESGIAAFAAANAAEGIEDVLARFTRAKNEEGN
jgi:DNA repair exonuclease SbcCD nuclease subunit